MTATTLYESIQQDIRAGLLSGSRLETPDAVTNQLRAMLAASEPVSLGEVLCQIPGLCWQPVALDAAIELAIGALLDQGKTLDAARSELERAHPELSPQIRAAANMEALLSTRHLRKLMGVDLPLPSGFGPPREDGVARYELLEKLGQGACGTVYRAVDRQFAGSDGEAGSMSHVAVKVQHPGLLMEDQAADLSHEARRLRYVRHECVAIVHDCGRDASGRCYMVMELAELGTLQEQLSGSPGPVENTVSILIEVCRGLDALHQVGVLHGDVKPSNVLLFPTGPGGRPRAKISDLSASHLLRPSQALVLDVCSPTGNRAFMAPEIHAGADRTIASDVFSAASMLRYCLRGTLDGEHEAESPTRSIDARLERIIDRATSQDPAERPSSARELACDLEAWLDGRSISWLDSPAARTGLWLRRRPSRGIAVAAGLLSVAGVTYAMSIRHEQAIFDRARADASKQIAALIDDQRAGSGARESLHNSLPELVAIELMQGDKFIGGTIEGRRSPELFAASLTSEIEQADPADLVTWLFRASRLVQQLLMADHLPGLVAEAAEIEAYFSDHSLSSMLAERTRVLHAVARIKHAWAERNRRGDAGMRESVESDLLVCSGFVDTMSASCDAAELHRVSADPVYRLALRAALQVSGPRGIDHPHTYERLAAIWRGVPAK